MKIAAITMARNESVFLPLWVKHYSGLVGRESLFVVDHASTDGSTLISGVSIIRLPDTELSETQRAVFISRLHYSLLAYFDCDIYTDADEYLVVDPRSGLSLVDFLTVCKQPVIAGIGVNILHDIQNELPLDLRKPILRQREWGQFSAGLCKPLVARRPVTWQAGFHATVENKIYLDVRLYLFHLKAVDWAISDQVRRTRNAVQLSKFDIDNEQSIHFMMDENQHKELFFKDRSFLVHNERPENFSFRTDIIDLMKNSQLVKNNVWSTDRIPDYFKDAVLGIS